MGLGESSFNTWDILIVFKKSIFREEFIPSRNLSNRDPESFPQLVLRSLGEAIRQTWQPKKIQLDDGRSLVLFRKVHRLDLNPLRKTVL